jgi:hypothetical protein
VGRRIAKGVREGAARQFVEELAFGPGARDDALPESRRFSYRTLPPPCTSWRARTRSISTTPPNMIDKEVGELVAAWPPNAFTDEQSADLLHHIP